MSIGYNEYCMKFSNDELKEYMIKYLINYLWNDKLIRFLSEDGEEIELNSSKKVGTIVFDGENENLFINFYGIHTSIFVYNIEIMFIDEKSKGIYTSSDVYNNVVYEGDLQKLSHREMLQMFSDIILCFADATDVLVTQSAVNEKNTGYNYYEPHTYVICVKNDHIVRKTRIYENITIIY